MQSVLSACPVPSLSQNLQRRSILRDLRLYDLRSLKSTKGSPAIVRELNTLQIPTSRWPRAGAHAVEKSAVDVHFVGSPKRWRDWHSLLLWDKYMSLLLLSWNTGLCALELVLATTRLGDLPQELAYGSTRIGSQT